MLHSCVVSAASIKMQIFCGPLLAVCPRLLAENPISSSERQGKRPRAAAHSWASCPGGRQVVLAALQGWALHHDLLSRCSPPCCEWSLALLSYSNHSSSPINFFLSLKITMQKGLWFWQCNNCNACVFLLIFADWPIWSAYVSVIQTYREWLCEDWRCCY